MSALAACSRSTKVGLQDGYSVVGKGKKTFKKKQNIVAC